MLNAKVLPKLDMLCVHQWSWIW